MSQGSSLLEAVGLTKSYGSFRCLAHVSVVFGADAGLVVLTGENGSGKTTLANLICGLAKPDHGRICFRGHDGTHKGFRWFTSMGMVRTFQEPRAFEQMSVEDCLLFAVRSRSTPGIGGCLLRSGQYREAEEAAHRSSEAWLMEAGWTDRRDTLAGELSYGQRKLLTLLMAVASSSQFLVLDEPTAGLDMRQTLLGVSLLQRWIGDGSGRAGLVITHEPEVFRSIASRWLRLSNGTLV